MDLWLNGLFRGVFRESGMDRLLIELYVVN